MKRGSITDFLDLLAEDEELQKDLVAMALKHGFEFGSDELSDASLGEVSGGTGLQIESYFSGWAEKANQVDQQLSAILLTMKDVRRIGVSGSDLGAS